MPELYKTCGDRRALTECMPGIQWPPSGVAGVALKAQEFGRLSEHLGYLLHRVDAVMMRKAAVAFDGLGLTPARATAAVYIGLHEGCDQAALGRALGINRASTMKVVNELVALGVVARREGRNRRTNALHLTKRGQGIRHEIEDMSAKTDAAHFSALTRQEQGELRRLLAKLHAAASSEEPRECAD
jgi:DNA-binding MarR family transcriptional regulator